MQLSQITNNAEIFSHTVVDDLIETNETIEDFPLLPLCYFCHNSSEDKIIALMTKCRLNKEKSYFTWILGRKTVLIWNLLVSG